ncbi:carbohydrate-binding domain-containing protein [Plebeiibacterium marinum]|uniref:Carbohydrate-binding domain-containing protein n=1 Tax=Plebeiibacterium marinum TaxID=2992111 RepID=A0AAE3MD90_9BACT|nr:carbohydrate-binding domain-containing protein [Plebeiobacterium marinum]MCW3804902.1 carbohydrate-binding domain-containing protein [Plebeiobacterium marinum]
MKQYNFLIGLIIALALVLNSCHRDADSISGNIESIDDDDDIDNDDDEDEDDSNLVLDDLGNMEGHEDEADYTWDINDVNSIVLNGSTITVTGEGAEVNGSVVTIISAGTYDISGDLDNGQVIVNTEDESTVRLILNSVDITCSNNAALYVQKSEKTVIILAEETTNYITDGSSYSSAEEDANAAVFSKSDLSIYGNGALVVNGKYNDGITSKDGLIIGNGNITVNSVDDGIRGKDYLIIKGGDININSQGDGIKSDNENSLAKGYISIESGTVEIEAGGDGIQAQTDVLVFGGEINITTGGGSSASLGYDESAKGIKSGVSTLVYDGVLSINAADDGMHSNGFHKIYAGVFEIASGDDGIHSDYDLDIEDGDIFITKSYEGLESSLGSITLNGGNINVVSSDDGINVSAGGDSGFGGRKSTSVTESEYALNINNEAYVYVNASGDGLDSNGNIYITGGTVLVNGPTSNGNGALDYDRTCEVSGGTLLAIGSSGMAQAPGSSSSQYSVKVNFRNTQSARTVFHIEDESGEGIFTYKSAKSFQSIVFSSPKLEKGVQYKLYTGGSSTGTETDGLYEGGNYTPGSVYTEFTISNIVTSIY